MPKQITKTDQEWRQQLSDEQYAVLRQKSTEYPGTGKYDQHFEAGSYSCAGCGNQLFASDSKFEAGCGWPSFYEALPGAVEFQRDGSLAVERTEVICAKCGGHLGHIFEGEGFDTPSDQRYCVNSASLEFSK